MKQLSILFFLLLIFSCQDQSEPTFEVQFISGDVSDNSLTPRLFTSNKGVTYLSWLEKNDKTVQFKFSTLQENTWSVPKLISAGNNWFVNWADFPSLIANNSTISAHWLQKKAEGTYDYDVRIAQSQNGGDSWSASFIPHNDGVAAEHGFVSMLPLPNDQNFATWLDGRNTKMSHGESDGHGHGSSGAMTLRAGVFNSSGEMVENWELDNRTCDCCQTTAAMTSDGIIVAYRDRSEDEIRDIYITKKVNGDWTTPLPVFNDNWEISGCPVNGPSIAAHEDQVAVAWFTAANGYPEVKMAISNDAGITFENPKVISQGKTMGRVAIAYLNNGQMALSWLDSYNDLANIMLATFDASGNEILRKSISQTSAARASGFPVITTINNDIIIAWTETQEEASKVKTARVKLSH